MTNCTPGRNVHTLIFLMILILVEIESDKQEVVEKVDEGEDGQEIEGDGELNDGDDVLKNLKGKNVRNSLMI